METIMMYSPPSPLLSLLGVTESDDRETLNMASGESPHPRAVPHHPITSAHCSDHTAEAKRNYAKLFFCATKIA